MCIYYNIIICMYVCTQSEPADEHMVDPSGMDDSTDSDLEADVLVTAQQKKEIEDADKQSVDKRGAAKGARYR